jgi:hypothetical protein
MISIRLRVHCHVRESRSNKGATRDVLWNPIDAVGSTWLSLPQRGSIMNSGNQEEGDRETRPVALISRISVVDTELDKPRRQSASPFLIVMICQLRDSNRRERSEQYLNTDKSTADSEWKSLWVFCLCFD